jgi:hypothetical protein
MDSMFEEALDYLPARKQTELQEVVRIIFEAFESSQAS